MRKSVIVIGKCLWTWPQSSWLWMKYTCNMRMPSMVWTTSSWPPATDARGANVHHAPPAQCPVAPTAWLDASCMATYGHILMLMMLRACLRRVRFWCRSLPGRLVQCGVNILPAMVGMVPHAKATVRPIWCTNATKSGANTCPNGLVVILDYSPSNQSPCNRVGAEAHAATCQPSQNICSSRCSHCCCASSIRN